MNQLSQAPIMRLFHLAIEPSSQKQFSVVGKSNLLTSLEKEAGTLFMATCQLPDQEDMKLVYEIYKDQTAYERHVASYHFQDFANYAGQFVRHRQVISLQAELLFEKEGKKALENACDYSIRLAKIIVNEEDAKQFRDVVAIEMEKAVQVEDGVISLFAARDQSQLNQWYFFEIYQDESAYLAHIETEHFKTYIRDAAEFVGEKQLSILSGELVISQGGLSYQQASL